MTHIKGIRFGFAPVKRLGLINDTETHRIAWNTHEGLEIHFVLRGRFTWEFRGERKPLVVNGGHFAIIPDRLAHRAADEAGTPSFRLGVILEPFSRKHTPGTSFSPSDLKSTLDDLSKQTLAPRPLSNGLIRCLREIRTAMDGFQPDSPSDSLRLRILSEFLLIETAAALKADCPLRHDDRLTKNICQWIDEHLTEDFHLNQLVKMSGYSRSRFFTLFRENTGMTPVDYIVRERIDLAKRLLARHPDLKASDIASRCGFKSHSFFTLNFRKQTGTTPSAFRAGLVPGRKSPKP